MKSGLYRWYHYHPNIGLASDYIVEVTNGFCIIIKNNSGSQLNVGYRWQIALGNSYGEFAEHCTLLEEPVDILKEMLIST